MVYSIEDGQKVVAMLHGSGFMSAKLIGSLGKGVKQSTNDIDILLKGYDESCKQNLSEILGNIGEIETTDWGGLYFHNTKFGTIDVFFTDEDFDY